MSRPPFVRPYALAVTALVAISLVWGLTFILVKWTVAAIDVHYFLFLRFLVASCILLACFRRQLTQIKKPPTLKAALCLGAFMCATYLLQTEGIRFTTAANSALITGLYLVFIPLGSTWLMRRRPPRLAVLGALVSFVGLYLLTEQGVSGFTFGDGLTFLCAVTCTGHILLTGKYANRHDVAALVIVQFLFTMGVCGAITLVKGSATLALPPIAILTLLVTAVFATALAFLIQTWAQRLVDPTRTGIIFALEAVFGTLFAVWLGGESFTPAAWIGAIGMIGGMLLAESRAMVRYLIDKTVG